jgi:hypothetical protein
MLGLSAWAVIFTAPASMSAQPVALHSEAGRFALQAFGLDNPERLNHMHAFDLSIVTTDGRPVGGALISIIGEHRFARNPLPTSPQVSPGDGTGSYHVEGLRFHVPGQWRLVVNIEFEQVRDRATLDILVK